MQDHKEHTMNYYGFTSEDQYDRFIELIEGPMNAMPAKLIQYIKDTSANSGFCGEVMFDCIAKFIKYDAGITGRDLYGVAMNVQTTEEAQQHMDRIVEYLQYRNPVWNYEHTSKVALQNLGYYAGYYDAETHERVNRLFRTTHPIFGNNY